jgi:hypothetical protein
MWEAEMRKQDRIARDEQNRSTEQPESNTAQREPREREQMKGSADEGSKPPRHSGKLPLPD